jgi:hypothetical protein
VRCLGHLRVTGNPSQSDSFRCRLYLRVVQQEVHPDGISRRSGEWTAEEECLCYFRYTADAEQLTQSAPVDKDGIELRY